jgi:hypothetical protein
VTDPSKPTYWYKKNNLKHVTGFLTAAKKAALKQIAKDHDMTMARYVTRLLEKHVEEYKHKD